MTGSNHIHQAKIELLEKCKRIGDIPRELPDVLKPKYSGHWQKFLKTVDEIKYKFINNNEPYNSSDDDYVQALKILQERILSD